MDLDSCFEFDSACCVDEAFKKLSTGHYDIVISDYQMPQKDGLRFLKELREGKNEIPFILFTGKGREEVVIQALNLGADHYVSKQGSPETVYSELEHLVSSAVEKSRSKLRNKNDSLALHNVHDAIVSSDANFIITAWNKAAEELFGYGSSEVLQKKIDDVFQKIQVKPNHEEIIRQLKTKGKFQGEIIYQNKKGQKRDGELNVIAIVSENGKFLGSVAVCHDITERKKSEFELKQKYDVLERVGESVGAGLAIIGKEYNIFWANKLLRNVIVDGSKKCYQNFNKLDTVCPDCGVKKVFEQNVGLDVHEFETVDTNGEKIWIELRVTPLKDKEGNVTAALELSVPITERKKTEQTLVESELQYRLLADNSQDVIWTMDLEGHFTYVSPSVYNLRGYTPQEVIKQSITEALTPESARIVLEGMQTFMETGIIPSIYFELEQPRKDGSTVLTEVNFTVIRDKNGEPQTILGVSRDITERVKAKKELLESEERYRSLFEQAPLPVAISALNGTILDANMAMQTFTGYSLEELKKTPAAYAFENPQDQKTLLETLERDNVVSNFSSQLKRKDGNSVDVVLSMSKFQIGKEAFLRTTIQNVTEQKKAEVALHESQQKFKALFSANPDAAVFLDTDFHVIEANSRFSILFGYSFDEIKGKIVTDLIVPADSTEESRILCQKIIAGSVEIFTTRKRKDGSLIPLFMSGGPVFVDEKVIGSVMLYKDISDIITVHDELSKALDKAELLNEKLRVVGGLTRHDVRNKLSAVNGYAYILKKKYSNQPEIVDRLNRMEQAVAESMKIFDFAKMYEQLGIEDLTYINVEAKIKEAHNLFSGSLPKTINDCQGLTVLADPFLSQLFYNFIDNTRKYGKTTTTIRIHYEKADRENLKLIYEDDGVGILAKDKSKLFKEGFSTGGSTGFGLFLISKMMDVYGWTISEEGEQGKGVKFIIIIPKLNRNGKENYHIVNETI